MKLKVAALVLGLMLLGTVGSVLVSAGKPPTRVAHAGPAAQQAQAASEEVFIPEGQFLMGCASDLWAYGCDGDTRPIHAVYLDAYYIDKTEVTVGEYAACVNAGVCHPPETNRQFEGAGTPIDPQDQAASHLHPVTYVTWNHAKTYCRWVGKRLPTEAEWEKAARGSDLRAFPWGNALPDCDRTNFGGCVGQTKPVGSYPQNASPYGVLDMAGNVREWVGDIYLKHYYYTSPYYNPFLSPEEISGEPLLRGGSWKDNFGGVTVWVRLDEAEIYDIYKVGFRCARTATGPIPGTPTPTPTLTPTPTPTPFAARTMDAEGGALWVSEREELTLLEVPSGSLSHTRAMTLTLAEAPVPGTWAESQIFRLIATSPQGAVQAETLGGPVAVLVTFPDASPIISGTLGLFRLTAGTWVTEGITLTAQGENYMRAMIQQPGVYGLLGRTHRLYLPVMAREG